MKYLEIIYEVSTGKILTTKIHGKLDTVIPDNHVMKCIPYIEKMCNDLDSKIFNGVELIDNPDYIIKVPIESDIDKLIKYAKKEGWII